MELERYSTREAIGRAVRRAAVALLGVCSVLYESGSLTVDVYPELVQAASRHVCYCGVACAC